MARTVYFLHQCNPVLERGSVKHKRCSKTVEWMKKWIRWFWNNESICLQNMCIKTMSAFWLNGPLQIKQGTSIRIHTWDQLNHWNSPLASGVVLQQILQTTIAIFSKIYLMTVPWKKTRAQEEKDSSINLQLILSHPLYHQGF